VTDTATGDRIKGSDRILSPSAMPEDSMEKQRYFITN
jgi:hypothetical protein